MKTWIVAAIAAFLLAPALAHAEGVANCSRAEAGGERTLCHEITIAAPVGAVWALWSTSEGLASWAVPVAAIEPRQGGMFESSYERSAHIGDAGNIRHRILAAEPERLLILQLANAPPGFPHADDARQLATVIELSSVDAEHTRVRVSMLGYRDGEGFDALYRHFEWGNDWALNKLNERVTDGPVDWSAPAPAPATQ